MKTNAMMMVKKCEVKKYEREVNSVYVVKIMNDVEKIWL